MRITCTNCGGAHPVWDCKRPAQKSTAARKDVPRLAEDRTATASGATTEQRAKYEVEAGTQALPVDTLCQLDPVMVVSQEQFEAFKAAGVRQERMQVNTRIPAPSPSGKAPDFGSGTAGSNPAGASTILYAGAPKPGRPRIHPDRKAYKAQKERERRARIKAEKEAGK